MGLYEMGSLRSIMGNKYFLRHIKIIREIKFKITFQPASLLLLLLLLLLHIVWIVGSVINNGKPITNRLNYGTA
jgi:hypothetical protein